MNTTRWMMGLLAACLMILAPMLASADVLELTPVETRVLPADGSGLTKIALKFDLAGMREGRGRAIFEALLDWKLGGIPEEAAVFTAHGATTSWSFAGDPPELAEDPVAAWDIRPVDDERGEELVRLDLKTLVAGWSDGTTPNFGIVVATPDVSTKTISNQIAKAKLTIRYSFVVD